MAFTFLGGFSLCAITNRLTLLISFESPDPPNANEYDNDDYGELSDAGSDSNGSFTSEEEGLILLELGEPEEDEDDDDDDLMDNQLLPSTSGELHLH
jgi:hypothetical protein